MLDLLRDWFRRYFGDPQAVYLALFLGGGFLIIYFFGRILAPALASVVIAYLLEGVVAFLQRRRLPRPVAVVLVFVVFLAAAVFLLLGLLPIISNQLAQLFGMIPEMVAAAQKILLLLPERYPEFFSTEQAGELTALLRRLLTDVGQSVVSFSLASLPGLAAVVIYLILVPFLVFFLLKDKKLILVWISDLLPRDRQAAARVWAEVDAQIGNYIRGKFWEIAIVGVASFATFSLLGLDFAALMGLVVGLSVLVPYVGAAVATAPVALVAYFQWGTTAEFWYVVIAYAAIQALDGNVLATLLLSEAVDLHPVAIILAILFFGGLWGFWGAFFAIPLATLTQAVLNVWPRTPPKDEGTAEPLRSGTPSPPGR